MAKRAGRLGQAVLDLLVDDSRFTSSLDKNKKKAQSWTASLNRDVKSGLAQGVGIGGGLLVANAVAGAVGMVKDVVVGSISAAMEWESAFAGVRKTVDASESEFAELEGAIRGMSKEIPTGTSELAGLAEAAGALGIAKDDIMEFTRVTALIGTTTDVASADAATALGQLSNVLGLTSADYEKFGSTLVDLGNKGASTESQILQIASRAGAGAKLIGIATDETLAWSSAVANLGIEVEAGGSALQKFFLDSTKAVSEGSEKLETYARIAGMTGAEFKRAFEEDASGALQVFLAGLGELTQGEQLKALADLDFNDVRITRTLLGLANGTDMVADSLDVASEAWEENTALMAEAEKRFDTTASKLKILENRVHDLGITFGEELLPHLTSAATFGVEQLEQFSGEMGSFAQDIGEYAQHVAGHFGDMGDEINALADEMDKDFMEVNDAITGYMGETGSSLEDAIAAVRAYGTGNTAALEQAGVAWELYQKQISVNTAAGTAAVEEGMEGAEAALLGGAEGIATGAGEVFEPIDAEAQKARDAMIDNLQAGIDGVRNLFESDETVRDAFQGLLDRMDDPYTEAERKADLFSQNTIALIQGAIVSGDPAIAQDVADLVNNMMTQFGLMEPGALERGEAVPPAIQAGMDAQMQALIDFVEAQHGVILEELTLDEAKQLGLDGIWLYAQGMRANIEEAKRAAAAAALAAVLALDKDASAGGRRIITTWIGGMTSAYDEQGWKIEGLVGHVADLVGRSLPRKGPLQHPDEGGESIGESWSDALTDALDGTVGTITDSLSSIGGLLSVPHVGMPSMPGAAGVTNNLGGSGFDAGSVSGGTVVNLYADFLVPPQSPAELDRMVQVIGPFAEQYFIRNRRFDRRPRN